MATLNEQYSEVIAELQRRGTTPGAKPVCDWASASPSSTTRSARSPMTSTGRSFHCAAAKPAPCWRRRYGSSSIRRSSGPTPTERGHVTEHEWDAAQEMEESEH